MTDPPPCVMPKRPVPMSTAAIAAGEVELYAEIGRYTVEATAYFDAHELCAKARRATR